MPDLHRAKVVAETPQGARVYRTGYSGNQSNQHYRLYRMSRAQRHNAAIFHNYLERLTSENGGQGGGKTAFTCAEPQAVLEALMAGATFQSVLVYGISCGGDSRYPCQAFCSEWLRPIGDGYYRLRMNRIQPPPQGGNHRRRRIVQSRQYGAGWFDVVYE